MGGLWRSRQWRKLLNLIDQLPPSSRFAEAIANDEEHVEMIVAAREKFNEDEDSSAPRLFGYDAQVERLDRLIDAIQVNTAATIAAAGGKPPTVQNQKRPITAFEKVAHRRKAAKHQSLTARMLRRQDDD